MDDQQLLCVLKTLLLITAGLERITNALDHVGPHITAEISKRGLGDRAEKLIEDFDIELNSRN